MESVYFGSYQQESDTPEPIEWLVLTEQDDRLLLLSRRALASLPWQDGADAITWDHSSLRAWLNAEFLQGAFTEEERTAILTVTLDNGDDFGYGTPVGESTEDQVFLLSGAELLQYLPENQRTTRTTRYAVQRGAYTNGDGNCAWWLRSPGMTATSPAYLSSGGSIGNRAHEADETIISVRPALWVSKAALAQNPPTDARELYDWAHSLSEDALTAMENEPITPTGMKMASTRCGSTSPEKSFPASRAASRRRASAASVCATSPSGTEGWRCNSKLCPA